MLRKLNHCNEVICFHKTFRNTVWRRILPTQEDREWWCPRKQIETHSLKLHLVYGAKTKTQLYKPQVFISPCIRNVNCIACCRDCYNDSHSQNQCLCVVPSHIDTKISHMNNLGQRDISKCDVSKVLISACVQ